MSLDEWIKTVFKSKINNILQIKIIYINLNYCYQYKNTVVIGYISYIHVIFHIFENLSWKLNVLHFAFKN